MSDPFVGEIRMFGGNYAPRGWTFCNGALMAISQNETLFTLIGTTYGGDGQSTFGIPNLLGRIPVHQGTNAGTPYSLGQMSGTESVTLTAGQMPVHTHPLNCGTATGTATTAAGNILAGSTLSPYTATAADSSMNNQSVSVAGGSQPHDNMMPYLCISFILSLEGIFPSQG